MKLLTIKKKTILIILSVLVAFASIISVLAITTSSMPKPEYTIVIDAGHGGRDGGAIGKTTGITESELNLKYALTIKNPL